MPEIRPHLSVYREIEAIKEAVALNVIRSCADWLRERDEPDIAEKLEAEFLTRDEVRE